MYVYIHMSSACSASVSASASAMHVQQRAAPKIRTLNSTNARCAMLVHLHHITTNKKKKGK